MSKMTEAQINSAKIAAKAAAYADNRGDVVAREEAMNADVTGLAPAKEVNHE